jgi:CRISPR-associated protein Csb1
MKPPELLNKLTSACRGGVSAVRIVTRLTPAGGTADKVFPPTYEGGQYAMEKRRIDGQGDVETVLLDSVQSQANRMEAALLEAVRNEQCDLPILQVRIPRINGETVVTTLDAPHRVFDAIFRDSLLDGKKFRESPLGKRLVNARTNNATALFETCPTALLFGMWDSTSGEGGTNAAKFPRALVSEIVGLNAVYGRRTSSRIDPVSIEKESATIYESKNDMWTLDEEEAVKDSKGKAKKYKTGRPSEINHGNVTPSISEEVEPKDITFSDEVHTDGVHHRLNLAFRRPPSPSKTKRPTSGGVTISEAVQTTVLALPQLRRFHFPDSANGKSSPDRDVAGRAVLAALALYATALQRDEGYFLRSRCHLIPLESSQYQFLGLTAKDVESLDLTTDLIRETFRLAVKQAQDAGLIWKTDVIELKPTDKLVELVRRSDEKVKTEGGDADARS